MMSAEISTLFPTTRFTTVSKKLPIFFRGGMSPLCAFSARRLVTVSRGLGLISQFHEQQAFGGNAHCFERKLTNSDCDCWLNRPFAYKKEMRGHIHRTTFPYAPQYTQQSMVAFESMQLKNYYYSRSVQPVSEPQPVRPAYERMDNSHSAMNPGLRENVWGTLRMPWRESSCLP